MPITPYPWSRPRSPNAYNRTIDKAAELDLTVEQFAEKAESRFGVLIDVSTIKQLGLNKQYRPYFQLCYAVSDLLLELEHPDQLEPLDWLD